MLVFPNCKINLGLHVTSKRPDGFHTIETIFYPVGWCDALEVLEATKTDLPFQLFQSGLPVEGDVKSNILYKAWELVASQKHIPPLKLQLHKNIPMGAGLGGGSADAAFLVNLLNDKFSLGYSLSEKTSLVSQLGSDCAFFISNAPVYAEGRGNEFSETGVDLSRYYILLAYPALHCNTKEAYEGLRPKAPAQDLRTVTGSLPVSQWKGTLVNDFEETAFKKYPAIRSLKNSLYDAGALYASMSGSGSAVFGIFEKEPAIKVPEEYRYYVQKPGSKIL